MLSSGGFGCSIGSLTTWDIYMTWNPTEGDCFPAIGKMRIRTADTTISQKPCACMQEMDI